MVNLHLKLSESEVSTALHCQLCMFNLLHSISNQELFEKYLCNPRILKEMVPCARYV